MAWGRHAPHTTEAARVSRGERPPAGTERSGIDADRDDRPAHAWEVDEAESWEQSPADTWEAPTGGGAGRHTGRRSEHEWAQAGPELGEAAETEGRADETAGPHRQEGWAGETATPAQQAERDGALTVRPQGPAPRDEPGVPQPPPARLALGLASLAAQRMRGGVPAGDGLVTGLGVIRQTANGLVALGERLLGPASRAAAAAMRGASTLPVVGPPVRAGMRSRVWLARSGAQARERIAAAVASAARGRTDDAAAGRPEMSTVDEGGSPVTTDRAASPPRSEGGGAQ